MNTEHINELFDRLGSMEGKQDLILENQKQHYTALEDHSKRLRTVEKNQARVFAWVAGVGAALSIMGKDIKDYLLGGS